VLLLHHVWGAFERIPRAAAEQYFRAQQRNHGGWELAYGDGGELSVTIEAYMALRLLGVGPDDDALRRARAFVLARGGISHARIFTKLHLALVGAYEWAGLPSLPPWLMVLPGRGPPLDLRPVELGARQHRTADPVVRPQARLRSAAALDELYAQGRAAARFELPRGNDGFERFFNGIDRVLKWTERIGLVPFRERGLPVGRAVDRRAAGAHRRLGRHHPRDGSTPMLALRAIGYDRDDPVVVRGLAAIDAFAIATGRRVSRAAVHLAGLGHRARGARARRRGRGRATTRGWCAAQPGCSINRSSRATATGR